MLRKTLKILAVVAVIAVAVGILWSRTHISYEEFAETGENAAWQDTEQQGATEFPEKVEETVNEGFSYDADVVTGDAFDAENFYESTAVLIAPDEEKWKEYFGVNDTTWTLQSEENGSSIANYYTDDTGNALLIMGESIMFTTDKMTPIFNILNTEIYSDMNNAEAFAEPTDLAFESGEENKITVKNAVEALGVDSDSLQTVSIYYMSAQRMEEQERLRAENGDIAAEEQETSWDGDDEAYYYFFAETSQGLPVLPAEVVEDYGRERNAQIIVCSGADGILYLKMENYFQVQQGTKKVSFVSFDAIKACVNEKYSQTSEDKTITVTKCELCLYPLLTGENAYTCVPVWICTLERTSSAGEDKRFIFRSTL